MVFGDDAHADAESFELGAFAPAKALLANYRTLIRQLDLRNPAKRTVGRHGGAE